jgi:hypothetical protein
MSQASSRFRPTLSSVGQMDGMLHQLSEAPREPRRGGGVDARVINRDRDIQQIAWLQCAIDIARFSSQCRQL